MQPIAVEWSSTNAASCSLSVSPALWTGPDPMVTPCNGSYQANVDYNTVQEEWRFTFTATNAAGQSASSKVNLTIEAPTPTTQPACNWVFYNALINGDGYCAPASGQSYYCPDASLSPEVCSQIYPNAYRP